MDRTDRNPSTRLVLAFAACAVFTGAAGLSHADLPRGDPKREPTLDEKEFFAEAEKALADKLKTVNEACGTQIKAR